MPQSVLRRDRVVGSLPQPLSDAALADLLSISKAELEAQDAETLTVSVTPDRLDLLSEGGLSLYLEGATEVAKGIPRERVVEGALCVALLRGRPVRPRPPTGDRWSPRHGADRRRPR